MLRYESFSCYNRSQYLSHSRDIFVGERIRKMAFLLPHTFVFICLPQGFWASILVLLIIEALKRKVGWLNKLLANLWLSYMAFA